MDYMNYNHIMNYMNYSWLKLFKQRGPDIMSDLEII